LVTIRSLSRHEQINDFFSGFSGAIGVWHGCFGSKQTTTKDFFIAGGKMDVRFFL
jgi:hypothetical protein